MVEEDSERDSGKAEGGGLRGGEMTVEAGLLGRGFNLEGGRTILLLLGPHKLFTLPHFKYNKIYIK